MVDPADRTVHLTPGSQAPQVKGKRHGKMTHVPNDRNAIRAHPQKVRPIVDDSLFKDPGAVGDKIREVKPLSESPLPGDSALVGRLLSDKEASGPGGPPEKIAKP